MSESENEPNASESRREEDPPREPTHMGGGDDEAPSGAAEVEQALEGAQESLARAQQVVDHATEPVNLPDLESGAEEQASRGIELLGDVDLDVTIELGRSEMLVEDVLKLGGGSVVELDKLAGDPVDVSVNGRLIARGEVLVLNDNFCIRISEVLANLEEEAEVAARSAADEGATPRE